MSCSRTTRRTAQLGAAVVALSLVLAGCGGADRTVAKAVFDDVIDLTTSNAVKVADITIGTIEAIELTEDDRALVTMSLQPDVALPARVTAQLRKTNLLGERYVEIVPDLASGGSFESGSTITETSVLPELEEAIQTGSELIAAIAADKLAGAIEAGAIGLDGRGETFGTLIDDVGTIVSTYEENSADLVRLLRGLDQFLVQVGPQAELHGQAVVELSRAARVLSEEDDRLIDALNELRVLARTGTDIISTHRGRIDDFFTRFQRLTDEVVEREGDLDRLFIELSKHNTNTIRGVNQEQAQVLLDFLVCGVNDEPGDPVRSCDDPPQGRPTPQPRPPQDY